MNKQEFINFAEKTIKRSTAYEYMRLINTIHNKFKLATNGSYQETKQLLNTVEQLVNIGALQKKYVTAWKKLVEFKKHQNDS